MKKEMITPKADFVFEISQEVVNHIGGVYAVMVSKSKEMKDYYGDHYYVIGPYIPRSAGSEFEEEEPPSDVKRLFEELKGEGISCHYGMWLVEGKPHAFLVDFSRRLKDARKIRDEMSKKYKLTLKHIKGQKQELTKGIIPQKEIDKLLVWGDSTSKLIKGLLKLERFKDRRGVLHFHNSGTSVFSLIADFKKENANIGLVTTLHSTRLGRIIAMTKGDLDKEIAANLRKRKKLSDTRAKSFGYPEISFHQFELLGVKNTDILTSVSETTATEAEYILGRKPDIVTPNGITVSTFPTLDERALIHDRSKNKIYEFLNAYFSPYYPMESKNSLLFFTSGRYELKTKGFGILIDALGNLNRMLKTEEYKKSIFVFLFIMKEEEEPDEEVIANVSIYKAIERAIDEEYPHIKNNIIDSLLYTHEIDKEKLLHEGFIVNTKKLILKLTQRRHKLPPLCAFKGLSKYDALLKQLRENGLNNEREDNVKVIFYPAPVSVADSMLAMDYFQVIAGMHLGIFPSLYEPWGYTPLETAASTVMSITSDSSGFGKFILKNTPQKEKPGILVLKTDGKKRENILGDLTGLLHYVASLKRNERIEKKLQAHKISKLADWEKFVREYIKAHNLAIDKAEARQKKRKKKKKK